jgi:uncharacterized protein (TIGR02270 family)
MESQGALEAVLWDVVEEHLDEAGFLWGQWERALVSPSLRVDEVTAGVEERLVANLDALVIAAPHAAARALEPALEEGEPGVVASAAMVLLETPRGSAVVRRALAGEDEPRRAALVRALGLSHRQELEREVQPLLSEDVPALAVAALEVFAARGLDAGSRLAAMFGARDPELAASALRAARFSASPVRSRVERAYGSSDPKVRDAALETGLFLGFRSSLEACRRVVSARAPSGFALSALAMSGVVSDEELIEQALEEPALRSGALRALGVAGRAGSVETILRWMDDEASARIAGEAFSAITGIPIADDLVASEQNDEGREDDDETLSAPEQDRDLPLPDASAVAARWGVETERFDPEVRYLSGRPLTPAVLVDSLYTAPMRHRPALALELAVRSRRSSWVDTRSWARDQLRRELRDAGPLSSDASAPLDRLLQA